jgi:uncharacterized protein
MDKVQHFELPAENMERAKTFYRTCFGLEIKSFPMSGQTYEMVNTVACDEENIPKETGAINGGMIQRNEWQSGPTIVITVDNMNDSVKKLEENGGTKLMGPHPVGDIGIYTLFRDTEGNGIVAEC